MREPPKDGTAGPGADGPNGAAGPSPKQPHDAGVTGSRDRASAEGGEDLVPGERPRTLPDAVAVIERLEERLVARDAELLELKDRLLRERADLENFKNRLQREKSESLRYASEPLLRDLLPVLDNLERAVRAARGTDPSSAPTRRAPAENASLEALATGVEMVLQQFSDVLERSGVTRVPATRQAFDPAHHEALAHVETDEHPPGSVVDEHASGYRLHDRLLRAAQVTVAKPSGRN